MDTVAVLVAVALNADTHVLTDGANLVELSIAVCGRDGVGRPVAAARWSAETIHEGLTGDVSTIVADASDDIVVRADCLSEHEHRGQTRRALNATVELTPRPTLLRRNGHDASHAVVVCLTVIASRCVSVAAWQSGVRTSRCTQRHLPVADNIHHRAGGACGRSATGAEKAQASGQRLTTKRRTRSRTGA